MSSPRRCTHTSNPEKPLSFSFLRSHCQISYDNIEQCNTVRVSGTLLIPNHASATLRPEHRISCPCPPTCPGQVPILLQSVVHQADPTHSFRSHIFPARLCHVQTNNSFLSWTLIFLVHWPFGGGVGWDGDHSSLFLTPSSISPTALCMRGIGWCWRIKGVLGSAGDSA